MTIDQESLNEINGLLIFKINDSEYCSDIKNIIGVHNISDGSEKEFNGIKSQLFFKKRQYKIIDINKILKTRPAKITHDSRLILFETFGKRFGFLVNKIVEIITTDSIFLENSLDLNLDTDIEYTNGELKFQDRRIYFLDFEKLSKGIEEF